MAKTKYLIIGGGAASAKAAVAIRERDKEGPVVLATRENHYPYDRPPLSKDFLVNDAMTPEDPETKDSTWYPANRVEVWKEAIATHIDRTARRVDFADGRSVDYELLLLATGATPIRPKIPGSDLNNVFTLRSVDDAGKIREAIQRGGHAVMIGGGYLGLEVAASATTRGVQCTIIDRQMRPWSAFASHGVGDFVQQRFEREGVKFVPGSSASEILGEGAVRAVRASTGEEFPADFVVIGVGVTLNTELARDAGLELDSKHAILVDRFLKSSDANIYAAGDVAAFYDKYSETVGHIEHHMNAGWLGSVAGANMAGEPLAYDRVAYFYLDAFDIHMALRGTQGGTLARQFGAVESGNFVEIYAGHAGRLQMGLIVSTDEKKLDPISEKIEAMIQESTLVEQVDPSAFSSLV